MTTTPGVRLLLALAGLTLLILSWWAILDGPQIHEDSAIAGEATEPSVQCFSTISGPWAGYDDAVAPANDPDAEAEPTYADVSSDPDELAALDADDVVHEGDDLPEPSDPDTSPDPSAAGAGNDVIAALQDKVERCDQARDQRVGLALLMGLPGVLLVAVGLTIGTRPPLPHRVEATGQAWPGKDGF